MNERQRTEALRICDDMQVTIAKIQADFAKLEQAAEEFRRDFDAWRKAHGLTT